MSLTPAFAEKAPPPAIMGAESYRNLLETLLTKGEGLGKTKNVGAFLVRDIQIDTTMSTGELETTNKLKVGLGAKAEPAYIVLDAEQYTTAHQRDLVVVDMAKQWGGKIIRERDLDQPDFKGPGIWLNKQSAVEFDYLPVDAADPRNSLRKPNPEAYRVCLEAEQAINLPVQWDGGFVVKAGGTVAIRERDVPALAEALQSIRSGEKTAEEALFTKPGVAKFDIYGMEPKFAKDNYGAITLKPETQAIAAALAPAATAQAAAPTAKV